MPKPMGSLIGFVYGYRVSPTSIVHLNSIALAPGVHSLSNSDAPSLMVGSLSARSLHFTKLALVAMLLSC